MTCWQVCGNRLHVQFKISPKPVIVDLKLVVSAKDNRRTVSFRLARVPHQLIGEAVACEGNELVGLSKVGSNPVDYLVDGAPFDTHEPMRAHQRRWRGCRDRLPIRVKCSRLSPKRSRPAASKPKYASGSKNSVASNTRCVTSSAIGINQSGNADGHRIVADDLDLKIPGDACFPYTILLCSEFVQVTV